MVQPQALMQQQASTMGHNAGLDYNQFNASQVQMPTRSPNNVGYSRRGNNSIVSFGNNLRSMSVTSETTFGRAMSGLSALSIDWETLDDFDLNVDHSSHINNNREQYMSNYNNV